MAIYSNILVAYDGSPLSDKALDQALELAQADENVKLHVVTVIEPLKIYDYHMQLSYDQIRKQYEEEVAEMRKSVEEKLHNIHNETKWVELNGYPAKMIIEYGEEHRCDLIVIGSRGLSDFKEMFLGSVSHNVVQRSSIPVLIVK